MSLQKPISLGEVHSELSCLLHAAQEYLKDLDCVVKIEYNQYTYLNLEIEVWGGTDRKKRVQAVVDRLHHGILHDEYDYRFDSIAVETPCRDKYGHYAPTPISARVSLHHWPHRKPYGWEPPLRPSERRSRVA